MISSVQIQNPQLPMVNPMLENTFTKTFRGTRYASRLIINPWLFRTLGKYTPYFFKSGSLLRLATTSSCTGRLCCIPGAVLAGEGDRFVGKVREDDQLAAECSMGRRWRASQVSGWPHRHLDRLRFQPTHFQSRAPFRAKESIAFLRPIHPFLAI